MMHGPGLKAVQITGGFWKERLKFNTEAALRHQWRQLEASGCIQNFRLAARQAEGFREGMFFADSDAYKWLDAAARTLTHSNDAWLRQQVDDFIALLEAAQESDGYIYTYNQLHFPEQRWQNLQLEHEFYCLGHLIEAGVSHFTATGAMRLLNIAQKAADLLVRTFMDAGSLQTDGHEEIEIALLRLYQTVGEKQYLELARRLLERRGKIGGYAWHFIQQTLRTAWRLKARDQQRAAYTREHPEHMVPKMPSRLLRRVPAGLPLRLAFSLLSGKYAQQNAPIEKQTRPVGHAVRFTYLEAATALLARLSGDASRLPVLETAWEHMVTRQLYVTGGLGALPLIEGFGRDYELDPELAYAETCAALGSLLWSWEMLQCMGGAKYADLFEWQLYNAASVSMAQDGCAYFYDNPLTVRDGLTRSQWYDVPCCPSNLSRTWAALGTYLYSQEPGQLWVHQYMTSRGSLEPGLILNAEAGLPWNGNVRLQFELDAPRETALHLRIPAWTDDYTLWLNGQPIETVEPTQPPPPETACGYAPHTARYLTVGRVWQNGDVLECDFSMPIRILQQDRRLPKCGGKAALARGPLVYCLESVDNPDCDIFNAMIRAGSLRAEVSPAHFEGITILCGETPAGKPLVFIPYLYWANRGASQMTVFVEG